MKEFPTIFGGIFAAFAFSFIGMAMVPQFQLGNVEPLVDEEAGDIYPIHAGGQAEQGRQVYIANGCVTCHSQQVRDDHMGADLKRGWGSRRTVARDYIYDNPVLLGTARTGPDLTNIGARQSTPMWHYLHLYSPRYVTPGSVMPPFRFLFEKRKITGQRPDDALDLTGVEAPEWGYEIVPKPEAKALVAYLISLDHSHALKEAGDTEPAAEKTPKK
ncbi:MAG: cytochrome c oxidase cbb3-type subunit [Chthoniobacter sp.]|nr:cytochrome c oxidase cbb3-type subunit [Chthoniobacter sp.]